MTRILVAECKQEVSSFNPVPSTLDDYLLMPGEELFRYHRNFRDEVRGAVEVIREALPDAELIPTYGARSVTSGGTLTADSWNRLRGEFLDALKGRGEVDAVYFSLHGAMGAENEDDPEGALLAGARQILGEEVPIIVSLDLHGIVTDRMLKHSDAVLIYHTYPHIDFFETGQRSGQVLLKCLAGAKPVMARIKIPALVRGDELITETGSIRHCIQMAQAFEKTDIGLAAGILIGNPFTDVTNLRTNSVVVSDGDRDEAERVARALAATFWQHHEGMQVPLTSLADAVELAKQTDGTTVFMDAADATSSGASGDSNAVARALMEADYQGTVLSPVVDPSAAQAAIAAGVGEFVQLTVGGALDPTRYKPLEIKARVRLVSDGRFLSETFKQHWYSGPTAVLEAEGTTFVVGSRPVSLYDRAFFQAHGQDPKQFNAVVVKSPHCEPHMFADWCDRLINVDAPGATSANLHSLGHTICARPVFPLDDGVEFEPLVEMYERG